MARTMLHCSSQGACTIAHGGVPHGMAELAVCTNKGGPAGCILEMQVAQQAAMGTGGALRHRRHGQQAAELRVLQGTGGLKLGTDFSLQPFFQCAGKVVNGAVQRLTGSIQPGDAQVLGVGSFDLPATQYGACPVPCRTPAARTSLRPPETSAGLWRLLRPASNMPAWRGRC